jgi:ABC-type sugar transport system ATPase subunit
MMGIGDLLDRKIAQLSGGQQQRVSLGRALVKEPQLLLFDEPLSNLDARLRLTMRGEIKRLQQDMGITSIYVTHDQVEAMTMADKIAVMSNGVLQAYDIPEDLYDHPKTLFVAGFVGNPPMNFFDVEIVSTNGDFYAKSGAIDLVLPHDRAKKAAEGAKGKVVMGVRPEDIRLFDDSAPPAVGRTLTASIEVVEPLGREDLLGVTIDGVEMRVLVDKTKGANIGDTVDLVFDMSKVQFFDPETELSPLWT